MSKNSTKLIIIAVTILAIAGLAYIGLSSRQPEPESTETHIVTSFYPLAYMAEQIGGDKVTVSSVITPGSEIHSWQPSISDIANTEDADLIIYLGAGLDHWMEEDILETIDIDGKIILEASEGIELVEIHEEEHEEHEEEENEDEEENGHEHEEGDPHLWVSPRTANMIAANIADAIIEADPENQEYYLQKWKEFEEKLQTLDENYVNTLGPVKGKTFFVTHSAYGYIAENYGLEQHGVIGISADEQPSTTQIMDIVEEMISEESYTIYIDPIYSEEYAQTLKTELEIRTGQDVQILKLYLIAGPMDDMDYLEQLQINLENLSKGMID
jgi:zinc transport system substrate-binding protein